MKRIFIVVVFLILLSSCHSILYVPYKNACKHIIPYTKECIKKDKLLNKDEQAQMIRECDSYLYNLKHYESAWWVK